MWFALNPHHVFLLPSQNVSPHLPLTTSWSVSTWNVQRSSTALSPIALLTTKTSRCKVPSSSHTVAQQHTACMEPSTYHAAIHQVSHKSCLAQADVLKAMMVKLGRLCIPFIWLQTVLRYCLRPSSFVTQMLMPYLSLCSKLSGGYMPR
jgi:hypothetical protein